MMLGANYSFVLTMSVLFGLGNAIGTVLPPLMASAIFSSEDYPKAYGYMQSALMLGMTSGSLLAATIADVSGSYNYSWLTLAILSILMAVLWVGAYQRSQKFMTK